MNIVFSSIFDLTEVFWEVSKGLEKQGHRIFWITTAEPWTEWLLGHGVERKDILELVYTKVEFMGKSARDKVLAELVGCEQVNETTVNQAMMMDRFILYKNKPDINEYMLLYYRDIKKFLLSKSIHLVFAEPTHCNEILTSMICRELGVNFVAPWDMRYPHERVIFTHGILQSELIDSNTQASYENDEGKQVIAKFREEQSAPFSFETLNREKVITLSKTLTIIRNRFKLLFISSRQNLTHHDISERLSTAVKRIVNSFYLKRIQEYDDLDNLKGKLAFYPLHVQPESSIDVKGSFYSDQLKLIKDIRRSLPFDITLLIKEHPNFLGQRSRSFFRQITRIPNVRLLSHSVSTFDIYKRISMLFTVTGTSAFEAGMLGIPAITFVPMYFDGFSSIHHCGDVTVLKPLVSTLLSKLDSDYEADGCFMTELLNKSFDAFWTTPLIDRKVLDRVNIQKLTKAFSSVADAFSK